MEIRLKLMCSVILLSLSSVCGSSGAEWYSDYRDTTIDDMAMAELESDSEVDSSDMYVDIHPYLKDEETEDDQNKLSETKIDSLVQSNAGVMKMLRALDMKINVLNERSSENVGLMHYLNEIMNQLNRIYEYITDPFNYQTTQPVLLEPHQMSVIENFIAAIGEENKVLANCRNCLGSVNKMDQPETQMCDTCNKIINGNRRCNDHHGGFNTETSPRRCVRDVQQDKRKVIYEPNKQHCHELETRRDGLYKFGSPNEVGNEAGRFFHEQYCEFDAAGNAWTVIQRRFVSDHKENFNRSWVDYKHGFGELDKEFWFGNDFIHELTWDGRMELLIVLEDYTGCQHRVEYSTFQIADEAKNYNVIIEGDLSTILIGNYQDFSTYDRPNNNNVSCAETMGMGWWFYSCTDVFARNYMGMKTVKIMVRPKGLRSGKSNDIDDVSNTHNSFCL